MGLYNDRVLPILIRLAMRNRRLVPYRRRVVGAAEGRVLEVGIGSGLNLPFYGSQVRGIIGLEPSAQLRSVTERAAERVQIPVKLLAGSAEHIPLDGHSVDTVVMTWTACSIPDVVAALGEVRRILRPGGRLLFAEHGRAPDPEIERWQDRLTPIWRRISGGCHLNRKIDDLIAGAEFRIERLDVGYMAGRNPWTFMYEGSAKPQ